MTKPDMPILRRRKTRILATLGPASSSYEVIRDLYLAGVDVFRLNMSHGKASEKQTLVDHIRRVERETGRPIAILADLQGPKLRIGTFAGGKVMLSEGQNFTLTLNQQDGDTAGVTLPHKEIFAALEVGTSLLLDDGKIRLRVKSVSADTAETVVEVGGPLSDRKGVNVPDVVLPLAALTPKDRSDLDAALSMGVDWIALSFVQRADDVAEAKKLVAGRAAVMAKIEKPAAVEALESIIELADAVMVARGDLGVEEPLEKVPGIQKAIIRTARHHGKPVVVATQMLESMIQAPVPTRAEVSDVAGAVADGADAVMLSAESAVGAYPCEAVKVMARIARQVEGEEGFTAGGGASPWRTSTTAEDAITAGARHVADHVGAAAIVTFTTSGATALRVARERPKAPIMVLTPAMKVARRLSPVWGLHTVKTRDVSSFEEMIGKAKRMALRHGIAKGGDRIVITAGVPFGTPGATNVMHVAWINGTELEDAE